jgi:hypothetical protein
MIHGVSFKVGVRDAFRRGETDVVVRMSRDEIDRARAVGDRDGEVEGLIALAGVAIRAGDLSRGAHLAEAALAVAAGDERLEPRPRHALAAIARMSGDFGRASELYRESIDLNLRLGHLEMVNTENHNLGFCELRLGNVARARELFEGGREWAFRDGYESFVPYVCAAGAALASASGDHPLSARMLAVADGAFAALGQVADPDDAAELVAVRTSAVAALGPAAFEREYARGRDLTPREAFERD